MRWRVGLVMNDKKVTNFVSPKFIHAGRKYDLELFVVDLNTDIANQGPFHAVVQKITYDLAAKEFDPVAAERFQRVKSYFDAHPEIPVIDPIDKLGPLISRATFQSVLEAAFEANPQSAFGLPPCAVVRSLAEAAKVVHTMSFPVLCKQVASCGVTTSHDMSLVFRAADLTGADGIAPLPLPLLVQQYVQHNAILLKVYVIETCAFAVTKPSLPNIEPSPQVPPFDFDSQVSISDTSAALQNHINKYTTSTQTQSTTSSTSTIQFKQEPTEYSQKHTIQKGEVIDIHVLASHDVVSSINTHTLAHAVHFIRAVIGCDLVGFDVVIDTCGKHNIVDVNYFPGYKGVPNVEELFCRFIHSKIPNSDAP